MSEVYQFLLRNTKANGMFYRTNSQEKKKQIKYIQPNISLNNPLHSRSMAELNPSQSLNKQNHFTSCTSGTHNLNQSKSSSKKSNSITKTLIKNSSVRKFRPNTNSITMSKMRKNPQQIYSCSIAQMKTTSQANLHEGMNFQKNICQKGKGKDEDNYQLLLKLKQYIQELKDKDDKTAIRIRELETENQELKQSNIILEDKLKVLEIRQNQIMKKIKKYENEKASKQNYSQQCQKYELIIQSLKNVINQQLEKIIQLQQDKISQQRGRNNYESGSKRDDLQNQQIYSFKKNRKNAGFQEDGEEIFKQSYQNSYSEEQKQKSDEYRLKLPRDYEDFSNQLENSIYSENSRDESDEILLEVGSYLENFRKSSRRN